MRQVIYEKIRKPVNFIRLYLDYVQDFLEQTPEQSPKSFASFCANKALYRRGKLLGIFAAIDRGDGTFGIGYSLVNPKRGKTGIKDSFCPKDGKNLAEIRAKGMKTFYISDFNANGVVLEKLRRFSSRAQKFFRDKKPGFAFIETPRPKGGVK